MIARNGWIHDPRAAVPRALLLDFGGVVVDTEPRPNWTQQLSTEVHRELVAAGCDEMSCAEIEIDIDAGQRADSAWKNAMSRPKYPAEMTPDQFWGQLVAADWQQTAREVVLDRAAQWCKRMGELRSKRSVRTGMDALLTTATNAEIPVGIVSNALSGAVHREFLVDIGWQDRFALQLYSDEVGIRKPNPEILHMAARALDLDASEAWYVGDKLDRDVVCGRRAGAGAVVLMESGSTHDRLYTPRDQPDAVVTDPQGLLTLLQGELNAQAI